MELIIKAVEESNYRDVGKCNGEFIVDSQLVLQVEDNQIHYTIVDRPVTKKRYDPDDVDYSTYIHNPEKAIYLAYITEKVAGQLVLRKNWNQFAFVEDIVVDVDYRGQGIGRALMLTAKRWAIEKKLAGIMLETQNNNVQACHFYESCGFKIAGFDLDLYRGLDAGTDEIALYWYLHFA